MTQRMQILTVDSIRDYIVTLHTHGEDMNSLPTLLAELQVPTPSSPETSIDNIVTATNQEDSNFNKDESNIV